MELRWHVAIKTLQQLASEEARNFPAPSKAALKDFYVDDLLTGAETIQNATTLVTDLMFGHNYGIEIDRLAERQVAADRRTLGLLVSTLSSLGR